MVYIRQNRKHGLREFEREQHQCSKKCYECPWTIEVVMPQDSHPSIPAATAVHIHLVVDVCVAEVGRYEDVLP